MEDGVSGPHSDMLGIEMEHLFLGQPDRNYQKAPPLLP